MHEKRAARAKREFSPLLVFGVVVLALALVGGAILGWQYWGSNVLARQAAGRDVAALREQWAAAPTATEDEAAPVVEQPTAHEAAWALRIPALELEWPIVAGVEASDLRRGIGWYPGTALPGQTGNFALAGHRTVQGAPFARLLELRVGDVVVIETPAATFSYTITVAPGDLTVQDDDTWVLDPVPGKDDTVPVEAVLTLTTAEDLINTPDRAVGFGTLTETETP